MGNLHDRRAQSESLEEMSTAVSFNIPEDLLLDILSFVPATDLINKCCLVCHHWDDLISGHGIWKRKCLRERRIIPKYNFETIPHNYYRNIYIHNPYERNLIKNPHGKENLKYWTIVCSHGNGWIVENPPKGADPVPERAGSQSCFATSYGDCIKQLVIDLIENGVNKEILDQVAPDIMVGEWYASRFDCGSLYSLKVVLWDANRHEIDTFEYGPIREEQWAGRAWTEAKHVFSGYPPGVRFITFEHFGKDTQFWAGHYGSKMTGGYVKFKCK